MAIYGDVDDEYNHVLNNQMDDIGRAVGIEICDDEDQDQSFLKRFKIIQFDIYKNRHEDGKYRIIFTGIVLNHDFQNNPIAPNININIFININDDATRFKTNYFLRHGVCSLVVRHYEWENRTFPIRVFLTIHHEAIQILRENII